MGGRVAAELGAALINRPETRLEIEAEALRQSVARGTPYGHPSWQRRAAARLKLESSLHPPWRRKRGSDGKKK